MKEGRENGQAVNDREREREGKKTVEREKKDGVTKDIYMHVGHHKRTRKITLSRTSLSSAMC